MNLVVEEIKSAIAGAAEKNQKSAMFHFQILKNARSLESIDSKKLCTEIGVPESYVSELPARNISDLAAC